MKMTKTGIAIILLIIINLIIGLNRTGFEYINAKPLKYFYPSDCDSSCLQKWTNPDKKYTASELANGLSFLKKETGIDTIKERENKIFSIAAYLFSTYNRQIGNPSKVMNEFKPLEQLQLLSTDTAEQIWCGNLQAIFGYFCTVIGVPNRYVEIITFPDSSPKETHEVNEVYFEKYKKWVMIDVTRNMLSVRKETMPVSSAEFLHACISDQPVTLQILKISTNNSFIFDTIIVEKKQEDHYFNKRSFLRYYFETDLKKVYRPIQKLKRYVLPDSWYAIYDPQKKYPNFGFRVKQFSIILLGLSLLIYLFLFFKNNYINK